MVIFILTPLSALVKNKEYMSKNKIMLFVISALGLLGAGAIGGTALMASAQSATTAPAVITTSTNTGASSSVDTPESTNDPADTDTGTKTHGHAPLGGDGVVSSISGTSIVIGEESGEGGAPYTVDASKAIVTNNGRAATLADIKVGDKIFVQGAVSGTSVSATSVSLGHPGWGGKDKANDTDGSAASETSETGSTSGASDQ
jgi:hypothetical protein